MPTYCIELLKFIWFQTLPIFTTIIFMFFLYQWILHKPIKNLPPSPPKLPFLGNIHQLSSHPHRSFHSLSQKYGDLMLVYLGSTPNLVVSSAKFAHEIMKTHDIVFSNRPSTKTINKLLYNGKDVASAQYGEYWRQVKSICVLHLLSAKRVRSFRTVREEEIAGIVEKIERSSNVEVNLSEMFMTLTNNVICRVVLGRICSEIEDCIDLRMHFKKFHEMLGAFRVGDFIPLLSWVNWLDGWDVKVDKVAQDFDQFLEKVVKEHEDHRRTRNQRGQDTTQTDDNVKDFVDVLLDLQEDNKMGFTIERDSIKAIILDVFTAGTDTTSTLLEWAMTELIRHPKVMQELQKEVRGIAGNKPYISENESEQMLYLKSVIKETLRLHPPIPLLAPRVSRTDTKINGYDIPGGIMVTINAWAIQRDPKSWNEPEKFDPDRFMNCSRDFKGQDFELIPFGAGRRICPGILFAMVNDELVLANLVHKFDWSLPGGANGESLDTSECVGITVHRETPLLAVATPRNRE